MEYIIKAIKKQQRKKKQIDAAKKWDFALNKVRKALATGKYSIVFIERSQIVKIFKEKKAK